MVLEESMAVLLPITVSKRATQGDRTVRGWVIGDTDKQVAVSDADWGRLGQFSIKKVRLLQRSTGLIVTRLGIERTRYLHELKLYGFHRDRGFLDEKISRHIIDNCLYLGSICKFCSG